MKQRGLSLIELMIAMMLGLMIISGVLSVFHATRQTYRSTESLSQLQESARSAFELLSRDLRQAGLIACGNSGSVANVLNGATANPFFNWVGLAGFDGDTAAPTITTGNEVGDRVAGTSAIQVQGIDGNGLAITNHAAASGSFKINAASTDFAVGDVLMVCDVSQSSLFQATGYNDATVTVTYKTGTNSPGNCSIGLGFPTDCNSTKGNPYTYGSNASIARFLSTIWYIGNNGRNDEGGQSLYRKRLGTEGNLVTEEIVAGIDNLQILYHVRGSDTWVNAASVDTAGNWPMIDAMKLAFNFESAETQVTDTTNNDGRLQHDFTQIIALRSRIP